MAGIGIVTDEIALKLFELHGRRAIVHVEEQIKLSLARADWAGVNSWRHVAVEIDKLARVPLRA